MRYGWMFINNQMAFAKSMRGIGMHDALLPVASAVPTQMSFAGTYVNVAALIQSAKLVNYDAITGNVVSAKTFNAGTYLNVWGKNND